MTLLPRRIRNHAGYHYTAGDHIQEWLMPDGTQIFTGWIEPGETGVADVFISSLEKRIAEDQAEADDQAELAKWKLLRAALESERG